MRWQDRRRSTNVEDQRGARIPGRVKGGGIGIFLLALVGMCFGVDPSTIFNMADSVQRVPSGSSAPARQSAEERQLADFVSVVLADTEDTWHQIFNANRKKYVEPILVLFSGEVRSDCGYAQAAMGPFLLSR